MICSARLLPTLAALLLVAPPTPLGFADDLVPDRDRGKAEAARAILSTWQAEGAGVGKPSERTLHVICWRSQDRDFAEGYRQRLARILDHIQAFYAEEMKRNGLGELTFALDRDEAGQLVIHEATGSGNHADYGVPDGDRIRKECLPVLEAAGIDADRETVLIFTNLSDWDPEKLTFQHKSPYYAGGNYRSGTAWQLDSPELDTENLVLKQPLMQDGQYGRISLGKHNSIFIGGIAHEMGHAFGLPHCRERKDEKALLGTALMGSGNRTYFDELRGEGKGSFLTLAHALRLASHPLFSGSEKGLNLPVKTAFEDLAIELGEDGSSFVVAGRVSGALPSYAVIAYLDPEGGGDYDARTEVAIPDGEGRFVLDCQELVPGQVADLRLVACLVNGATHTWQSCYRVDDAGRVDATAMQFTLRLDPFGRALQVGDFTKAVEWRDGFKPGSRERRLADSLLRARRGERELRPADDLPEEVKAFPLSRIEPVEAIVGWQKPAYDHLPRAQPLLVSAGEVFETGIYAHAESRHRYDLSGASWKRLVGKCGLPVQKGGSVVFVIKTDGREVFRSKKTKPGRLHAFDIDVSGVESLELMTEDGGDGKASDWGLWLGAELRR